MKSFLIASALALTVSTPVFAQEPKLDVTRLTDTLHMLSGRGGNIGVLTGPDGTFLIDDQMAPVVPALLEKIAELGGDTPRFLVNTHYHFDHTGGNEAIGALGTAIISHDNARKRLAEGSTIPAFNATNPPVAAAALPIVTYSDTMHFHLNGETLRTVHVPNAHTDGDSVIYFETANAVHTGDIFFNGFYPFIDTHNGGSLAGTIAAVKMILGTTDEETKIIPGHGPLATRTDLQAYHDMLVFAEKSFSDLKQQGKTLEDAITSKPLAEYDADWSGRLFSTDEWIRLLYKSVK